MTSGSETYGDTKIVALPPFNVPVSACGIRFWYKHENASYGQLQIGYVTGPDLAATFQPLISLPATTTLTQIDSTMLSNAPANATRIALRWTHNASFYSVGIDDIEVWGTDLCPAPAVASITNDYQSATITVSGNGNDYELTYGTDPSNLGNPMTSTTGIFNITGLTPATQYFFAVTQTCDSGMVSAATTGNFTTDSLPCFEPTDLAVVNTTFNSAELSWTSTGNATSWVISITGAGVTRYDTVTTNPYTVTGLYADQQYSVMVMAVCGGGAAESGWSDAVTFTTDICTPVSNVTVDNITASSATVNWNAVAGSMGYKLFYGFPGFYDTEAQTAEVGANSTNYTITGLAAETAYEVYVLNRCTETLYSNVTANDRVGFSTIAGNGIYDVETGTLTLYPNPASTTVTLTVTGFDGEVEVEIVDMNGKRVSALRTQNSELQIDLGQIATGAYFVRVTGEHQTAVRKLIVK